MTNTSRRALAAGLLLMAAALAGRADAQAPATPAPAPAQPSTPGQAQDGSSATGDQAGALELTRAAIQVRRQALVTAAMDLEPAEAERFWPLYREYRLEMTRVGDRAVKVISTYLDHYESMTDATASKLLDDYLAVEKARLGVKTKYVPRFRKVLPARKVARFFQVESRLDAAINAELAEDIPLLR
jgi:hypothetical protein